MQLWKYIKAKMLENSGSLFAENGSSFGYEQVIEQAEQLATRLKGVGCAALCCSSELMQAIGLLACLAAEVTALPVSVRYGEEHVRRITQAISPDAVIADDGDELHLVACPDSAFVRPKCRPALIMCTSGTTGAPKGVMLTERSILSNIKAVNGYFGLSPSDRILISRPLYHCAVLTGELLTALSAGANIFFYSTGFDPLELSRLIEKQGITVFCGTPTMLYALARLSSAERLKGVKKVTVSGECLDGERADRICGAFKEAEIYSVYGLTEASTRVSCLPPELFKGHSDTVGFPLPSVQIKLCDERGEALPAGAVGQLCIRGEGITAGYYGSPELTEKAFDNGWFKTGDLAEFTEEGLIRLHGRIDGMLNRAGMNIYPAEAEAAMYRDPRVREVCVFGEGEGSEQRLCMSVSGDFSSKSEVLEAAIGLLPAYEIPDRIFLYGELPKTPSGKLKRVKSNA